MSTAEGFVLRCSSIGKRFGKTVALDGFDLTLKDGVLLGLLGPSGCGKTTALRIMAGFERPDNGEVWVGDKKVAGGSTWVPPERRRIGMVFQDWALFPHLDVWHNVAFGLASGEKERVEEVLRLVRLEGLERRMPHELSGGQQQRVALARALAPSPEVVLLDEPFSNLDATLRARVRAEVREVLYEAKATAIFVTHDQEEALSMADELAVMANGQLLQIGSPHQVYGEPVSRTVAALVGESNFLPATIRNNEATTAAGRLPVHGIPDGQAVVMLRPEAVKLEPDPEGEATVIRAEFYGHDQLVSALLRDGTVLDARLLGPHPELTIDMPVAVKIIGVPRVFVGTT